MTARRRKRADDRAAYAVPARFERPLDFGEIKPTSTEPQPAVDVIEQAMVRLTESWRRRADAIMEQVDMRHPSATALIRHARVLRESAGEMTTTLEQARRKRDARPDDTAT